MPNSSRVLIADDEKTFLLSTAELIRQQGYHCDSAMNTDEVLQHLQRYKYDLLIADIKMPGNVNLEMIDQMSDVDEYLPIIIVTGYPSLHTAIRSIEIEMPIVSYMIKPLEIQQLLGNVRKAIKYSRVCRTIDQSNSLLMEWQNDLRMYKTVVKQKKSGISQKSIDPYIEFTVRNANQALADSQHLSESLGFKQNLQYFCNVRLCSHITKLKETIEYAITVLEKTKSSFKSKELFKLRQNLEIVLKQYQGNVV